MPKHPDPLARAALRFQGETLTCTLCGKQEQSDPHVESNWRYIEADSKGAYICPKHFPKDGASAKEFEAAYYYIFRTLFTGASPT